MKTNPRRSEDALGEMPHTARTPASSDQGDVGQALLLAATALVPSLTQSGFEFIRAALGGGAPWWDWDEYRSWAIASGAAAPGGDGEVLVMGNPEGDRPPDAQASKEAARLLLDHWLTHPEPSLTSEAVEWATRVGAWDDLSDIWLSHLLHNGTWRTPAIVGLLQALPLEARSAAPLLTLAWAQARAANVDGVAGLRQQMRDRLSDATILHVRWREAKEINAVLLGATMWMISQRAMPGIDPVIALQLAWETQNEAAMTLELRRARATCRTTRAEAIFRAVSANVALARGDLERAVIEADHAVILDPAASGWIADGVGALARELAGGRPEVVIRRERTLGINFGFGRGIVEADALAALVADVLLSIRKLDREACERSMASLRGIGTGAPMWTVALFAEALYAALWALPSSALAQLDNARANHGMASVEQLEPLGRTLLHRARIALLDGLGASAAARAAAEQLDAQWRALAESRSLLWAGDYDSARRIADIGLYDERTWLGDRLSLRAVRAGAQVLDPASSESSRIEAVHDVFVDCLEREALLPIALLPADLRSEMMAIYLAHSRGSSGVENEAALFERLRGVASASGLVAAPVTLTRREKVLLPLLASADAVPEIAASLHVSRNTVRTQVVNLRRKFGAGSRTELVRFARNAGLL